MVIEADESFYVFYIVRVCTEKSSLAITLTIKKDNASGSSENKVTYLCSGSQTQGLKKLKILFKKIIKYLYLFVLTHQKLSDEHNIKSVERMSSVEKSYSDNWRLIAYRLQNDEPLKLLNVGVFVATDAGESVTHLGYLQVFIYSI